MTISLPTANPFAGLEIFEDRVVFADLVRDVEIAGVRGRIIPAQRSPQIVTAHVALLQMRGHRGAAFRLAVAVAVYFSAASTISIS
jgi:hypothetical protein